MRDAARIPLLLVVAMLSASQEYNLTLFGNLSAPAAPLVVDGSVIIMMSSVTLQGFSIANPTVPLWTFTMDDSFCCNTAGSDANSASASACGSTPSFNVIRGRGLALVGCGPFLAVLNTTTGSNVSAWYTIPDSDMLSQAAVSSTYNVALVSLQSCRVFALNMTAWELLWHVNASTALQPLVSTTAGDSAVVVFSFVDSFQGLVDGYSSVNGQHLWNVKAAMWSSQQTANYPSQSRTVFVWCGPDFASVRMLYIPTGAYHQWIPESMVQFAIPTDKGFVVVVTLTRATVLNASTGVVVWSVRPGFNIAYARVSYGGQYVTVYPPPEEVSVGVPTLVYATDEGTLAGNCGFGHCSEPCVSASLFSASLVLIANCSVANPDAAVVGLLDVRELTPVALAVAPIAVVSGAGAPVSLQTLTNDGLVAITTINTLNYLQVSLVSERRSTLHAQEGPPTPLFESPLVDAGVAMALLAVGAALVTAIYSQFRRRPTPTPTATHEQPLARVLIDDDETGSVDGAESVADI